MTYDYVKGSAAFETADDHGRRALLTALTHDDRGSLYQIAQRTQTKCGGKLWVEPRMLGAKNLVKYGFAGKHDCYVSVNGFTSRKGRAADNCRQVNCLLFDIDFHENPKFAYVLIEMLVSVLLKACSDGEMPMPTFIVDTGCGVQLYYILEKSIPVKKAKDTRNAAALDFLDDVESRMDDALDGVLKRFGIEGEVDRRVHDLSRVARVPGTVNTRNGEVCRVVAEPGGYVTLNSMSSMLAKKKRKAAKPKRYCRRMRYNYLAMSRMSGLERLRDKRGVDADGSRESMCFLFYNSAVQVYESRDEARLLLDAFNDGMANPLDRKELEGIARSVDKVGFYRYGKSKLADKLCLGDDECSLFFVSKRDIERAQSKKRTAAKKTERDRLIRELYGKGCYTQAEVAKLVGCCDKTVRNVLNHTYVRKGEMKPQSSTGAAVAVEGQMQKPAKKWQTVLRGVAGGCGAFEPQCGGGSGNVVGPAKMMARASTGCGVHAGDETVNVASGCASQRVRFRSLRAIACFADGAFRAAVSSRLLAGRDLEEPVSRTGRFGLKLGADCSRCGPGFSV